MDQYFIVAMCACLGALFHWFQRDGENEYVLGQELTRDVWTGAQLIMSAILIHIHGQFGEGFWGYVAYASAIALVGAYLTDAVNLTLRGPVNTIVRCTNRRHQLLFWIFGKDIGDNVGWPLWISNSVLRWGYVGGVAWIIDEPWLCVMILIGSVATWPIGHKIWFWLLEHHPNQRVRFSEGPPEFGAMINGLLFFGLLSALCLEVI